VTPHDKKHTNVAVSHYIIQTHQSILRWIDEICDYCKLNATERKNLFSSLGVDSFGYPMYPQPTQNYLNPEAGHNLGLGNVGDLLTVFVSAAMREWHFLYTLGTTHVFLIHPKNKNSFPPPYKYNSEYFDYVT